MEDNAEFVRLEQFVDKLLVKYEKLLEMYGALEADLGERNTECVKLKEQLAELRSERAKVGEKVSGLIDRIEQWEAGIDDEISSNEDLEGAQRNLFAGDTETVK